MRLFSLALHLRRYLPSGTYCSNGCPASANNQLVSTARDQTLSHAYNGHRHYHQPRRL